LDQTLAGHEAEVRCVAFSPDGRLLASGSTDETIRLWNPKAALPDEPFHAFPAGALGIVRSLDLRHIGVLFTNGIIANWELPAMRQTFTGKTNDFQGFGLVASISNDGTLVAFGHEDGSIAITDLRTHRILTNWVAYRDFARLIVFSHDNSSLLTVDSRQKLKFWELHPLRERWAQTVSVGGGFEISTNNQRIYVGGAGRVTVLDAGTGNQIQSLDTRKPKINYWNVSRDGRMVVTAVASEIKVWSLDSPDEPLATLTLPESSVREVAFTPDAHRLVVLTNDAVKIYDLSTSQEVGSLRTRPSNGFAILEFIDKGNVLAAVTLEGIYTWRAPSWAEVAAAEVNEKNEDWSP
jgi:WD40 repeat protein